MKIMVYEGPGKLKVEEVNDFSIKEDEVRMKSLRQYGNAVEDCQRIQSIRKKEWILTCISEILNMQTLAGGICLRSIPTPVWINKNTEVRNWAMVEFRPTQSGFKQVSYINNKYKLVVYHDRAYGELYDLCKDPDQYDNLWDKQKYADIKTNMINKLMDAFMESDGKLRERTSGA